SNSPPTRFPTRFERETRQHSPSPIGWEFGLECRMFPQGSMRHQIKNNVDGQWIRARFGEQMEVLQVFAFAFPAVAGIGVVERDDHNALFIVEPGADVHVPRTLAAPS